MAKKKTPRRRKGAAPPAPAPLPPPPLPPPSSPSRQARFTGADLTISSLPPYCVDSGGVLSDVVRGSSNNGALRRVWVAILPGEHNSTGDLPDNPWDSDVPSYVEGVVEGDEIQWHCDGASGAQGGGAIDTLVAWGVFEDSSIICRASQVFQGLSGSASTCSGHTVAYALRLERTFERTFKPQRYAVKMYAPSLHVPWPSASFLRDGLLAGRRIAVEFDTKQSGDKTAVWRRGSRSKQQGAWRLSVSPVGATLVGTLELRAAGSDDDDPPLVWTTGNWDFGRRNVLQGASLPTVFVDPV